MSIVTVTKDRYTVDNPLYQWDSNQVLEIRGLSLPTVPEIHYTNTAMDRTIVRSATMDSAGVIRSEIPNTLLQKPYKITAYICTYTGKTFESLYAIEIPVKARNKPSDYEFTDTAGEVYSFNALESMVKTALTSATNTYNSATKELNNATAKLNEAAEAYKDAGDNLTEIAEDYNPILESKLDKVESDGYMFHAYVTRGSSQDVAKLSTGPEPGSIVYRNAETGRSQIADPSVDDDIANKKYVDTVKTDLETELNTVKTDLETGYMKAGNGIAYLDINPNIALTVTSESTIGPVELGDIDLGEILDYDKIIGISFRVGDACYFGLRNMPANDCKIYCQMVNAPSDLFFGGCATVMFWGYGTTTNTFMRITNARYLVTSSGSLAWQDVSSGNGLSGKITYVRIYYRV